MKDELIDRSTLHADNGKFLLEDSNYKEYIIFVIIFTYKICY